MGWRPHLGERIHNIFLSLALTIVRCVNVEKNAAECMISDGELTRLRGLGVDEVGVDFGPKAETSAIYWDRA